MYEPAAAFALLDLETKAVFSADPLRNRLINGLIDTREDTRLHQIGDDLEGLLLELLRQFPNDDGRLDGVGIAPDDISMGSRLDKRGFV